MRIGDSLRLAISVGRHETDESACARSEHARPPRMAGFHPTERFGGLGSGVGQGGSDPEPSGCGGAGVDSPAASTNGRSCRDATRSRACETFEHSRARFSAGASRPRATRARKKLPSRPISRSFSRTTVRRCAQTSRFASAIRRTARRRGNCSCRCLMPHKTSTRRPPAPADWRRLPRAERSASCAAPGFPPACCSTASLSA